ncbi:hypothetical protein [Sphaerothrix gracilis]
MALLNQGMNLVFSGRERADNRGESAVVLMTPERAIALSRYD